MTPGRVPTAPPSVVVGTIQQVNFWRAITGGNAHVVLEALAGCGKSFSIIEAGKRALSLCPNLRVVYLAFNTSSADDLRPKAPRGAAVKTLHSLGFAAIIRHLGHKPVIDTQKVKKLLKGFLLPEELRRDRPAREIASPVCALVSLCKSYLYSGSADDLQALLDRHDVEISANPSKGGAPFIYNDEQLKKRVFELVPKVLAACAQTLTTIDYDDQIWLPVTLDLAVDTFDLAFGDEVQDWNLCQQKLVFKACPEGRIVIVGDVNQSIYGFRGADSESIPRMTALLKATARGVETYPLTQTRRCPKSHVLKAQALVPEFEALPDAPEGIIETIKETELTAHVQPGDMVLCRTNAPLVSVAHQLLRAEKKAILRGKDLSGVIRDLIEGLGAKTIQELGDLLEKYRDAEAARLEEADKSAAIIANHQDKCDTLEVLMEGVSSLPELDAKISRIFPKKKDEAEGEDGEAILLTSVHGAKGLEARNIFILRPDLMPHPAAVKKARPNDMKQEGNIEYVALTRSKHRLVFVQPKAPPASLPPALARSVSEVWEKHHGDQPELEPDEDADEPETVDVDEPNEIETVPTSWHERARAALIRLEAEAPFDAPIEYLDRLAATKEALPRW